MVIIHTNPGLQNQIDCATALKAGFERHDIDATITDKRTWDGDRWATHIVQGPWYCYADWVGKPNVLFLNRCFYGCAKTVISLGWLNADGSRDFRNQDKTEGKGVLPELKERKPGTRRAVIYGDYGRDPTPEMNHARFKYDSLWYKPHPQEKKNTGWLTISGTLQEVLDMTDVAVGYSTTALVDAELNGCHVDSTDPHHVVHHGGDRVDWLNKLSWTQWSLDELRAGTFWDHLC